MIRLGAEAYPVGQLRCHVEALILPANLALHKVAVREEVPTARK